MVAWQATREITDEYSFTVQLVDPQGHVWARNADASYGVFSSDVAVAAGQSRR